MATYNANGWFHRKKTKLVSITNKIVNPTNSHPQLPATCLNQGPWQFSIQ